MKTYYNIKAIRGIIADCAWKLRKAYAEKDKDEFDYQMHHFGGYFILGFISDTAYHRAMQMGYDLVKPIL